MLQTRIRFFRSNSKVLLILQILILISIPLFYFNDFSINEYRKLLPETVISLIFNLASLFFFSRFVFKIKNLPFINQYLFSFLGYLFVYALLFIFILACNFKFFFEIILIGFFVNLCFFSFNFYIHSLNPLIFLCLPSRRNKYLKNSRFIKFRSFSRPRFPDFHFNGVIVDFDNSNLTPAWEEFLTECILNKIHLYNYNLFHEFISGKIDINLLAMSEIELFSPRKYVMLFKRVIDLFFVIVTLPVILPLIFLISLCVYLDSRGSIFYIQPRMGLGGKPFNLYKFRSMHEDSNGANFTKKNEVHRITNFGKFMRKKRLDELPQFLNVLKGDMSLIGPRPESMSLALWYKKEIPFFIYRHAVRPGLSGWAQVIQGYAAGVNEMKYKIGYDFFYIKNYSLSLDFVIWFKTIKIIFTGFGSR